MTQNEINGHDLLEGEQVSWLPTNLFDKKDSVKERTGIALDEVSWLPTNLFDKTDDVKERTGIALDDVSWVPTNLFNK